MKRYKCKHNDQNNCCFDEGITEISRSIGELLNWKKEIHSAVASFFSKLFYLNCCIFQRPEQPLTNDCHSSTGIKD